MGFFDSLGDALGKGASSAMNSLMEKERKIENYVEKYQYRDDEFLWIKLLVNLDYLFRSSYMSV